MQTQIRRTKQHFKNLIEVLARFDLEECQYGHRPQLEQYHSISEYKRTTSGYREDIFAMGIYKDSEFNSIKHIHLDRKTKLVFVIEDREDDLIITCAVVSGVIPHKQANKIVLDIDGFKKAINGFNKEILSWGYSIQKRFKIKKLIEVFNAHFINDVKSVDTRFKIEYATPIIKKNSEKELKELTLAKGNYTRKSSKVNIAYKEINAKVEAYKIQLMEELNYKKLYDDRAKASKRLNVAKENVKEKIISEYKNDKRFTFGFPLIILKRAFKEVFSY